MVEEYFPFPLGLLRGVGLKGEDAQSERRSGIVKYVETLELRVGKTFRGRARSLRMGQSRLLKDCSATVLESPSASLQAPGKHRGYRE